MASAPRSADRPAIQRAWTIRDDGATPTLQLRFRLTPKSSRDAIDGLVETSDGQERIMAIKARVRAIPENSAANAALIATAAKWLGVPKSSISFSAGGKSRIKQLSILAATEEVRRITGQIDDLAAT